LIVDEFALVLLELIIAEALLDAKVLAAVELVAGEEVEPPPPQPTINVLTAKSHNGSAIFFILILLNISTKATQKF
jgi:hypothetical protein